MKKSKIFSGKGVSERTRASYALQVQKAYLADQIRSLKRQDLLKFSSLKNVNPKSFKAKGTTEEIQAQTEQIKKLLASPLSSAWDIKMKRGKLTPIRPAQPARPERPPEPDRPSRSGVNYDQDEDEDEDVDFEEYDDFGDGYHGGSGASESEPPTTGPEAPTTGPGAHDRYSDIMDMIPEDERDDVREEYTSGDVFWLGDTMIDNDMSIDEAREAFDRQRERRLKELEPEKNPEPF